MEYSQYCRKELDLGHPSQPRVESACKIKEQKRDSDEEDGCQNDSDFSKHSSGFYQFMTAQSKYSLNSFMARSSCSGVLVFMSLSGYSCPMDSYLWIPRVW